MKVLRYFRVALESIFANKLRSSLTMLGIIIGVAAVLITMGIGAGASASITADIQSQGVNKLTINANASTLTIGDAEALADAQTHPELELVAPQYGSQATLVYGENNRQGQVVGVTPTFAIANNLTVATGTFFDEQAVEDWAKVVVLGSSVASELFGRTDPIGQSLRIGNELFTVIGVLTQTGGQGFGSNDDQAFVPLTVAQGRLFPAPRYRGTLTVSAITLQVRSAELMDQAQKRVEETLRLRHGLKASDRNDFTIFNQASLLEIANSITATLTVFLGSIGAVSLLVGGIGIMNIMLVSVTERTKEIGLRKALGAHDNDILLQFLIEALVLCFLGGLIGMGLSFGVGALIAQIPGFGFQLIFENSALILALSVCTACGFIFGLYPALRATRLDPIEALRYE